MAISSHIDAAVSASTPSTIQNSRPWPKDIFEQAQDRVYRLGNAATLPTTVADRQLTETYVTNGWMLPIIMKIKNTNEPRKENKRVVIVS